MPTPYLVFVLLFIQIARHLNPPLKFHINAPSPSAPRHRNRHVSSQLAVDSSGREHLLLHFYVEAAPPQSSTPEAEGLPALADLTLDSVYEWSTETWNDVVDSSKRAFAYLVGMRLQPDSQQADQPRSQPQSPGRQTEIGKPAKDVSTAWSFAGLFSGLRGMSTPATDSNDTHAQAEWTEGEVHADLVKDDQGNFKYRYLLVDIPRMFDWLGHTCIMVLLIGLSDICRFENAEAAAHLCRKGCWLP